MKRKHRLEPNLEPQKRLVEPLSFKPLRLNIELFFLKPLHLYVRPVSGTFVRSLLTFKWNLDPKPLCGTFITHRHASSCETARARRDLADLASL